MEAIKKIISVDFEIFGRVQGVWFRKYTHLQATSLKLVGWCMNTINGTVTGIVQGEPNNVSEMKTWLEKIGSPESSIERAIFSNERELAREEFTEFTIRR